MPKSEKPFSKARRVARPVAAAGASLTAAMVAAGAAAPTAAVEPAISHGGQRSLTGPAIPLLAPLGPDRPLARRLLDGQPLHDHLLHPGVDRHVRVWRRLAGSQREHRGRRRLSDPALDLDGLWRQRLAAGCFARRAERDRGQDLRQRRPRRVVVLTKT